MRGVFTALVTPFTETNELDLDAFRRILHDQAIARVSGVIPCGTTGESPTLSITEKKMLIRTALDELKNTSTQVIAGTGTNNTEETLEFSKWADQQGVAGIMLVTPYYNKPSQAGLEAHFRKVADAVSCEVVLYHVPGRTGVSLTSETICRLATHPRIRTIKESTGSTVLTNEILDGLSLQNLSMDILSGDDFNFLPMLSVGASGVVSVASNLFPRAMVGIMKAMDTGNLAEALKIHRRFSPLFRDLFIESNPVPVKHAMAFAGWCTPSVRLPLAPLSAAHANQLNASLERCGISKGKPA